jgi:small subunit ribosomal protein S13
MPRIAGVDIPGDKRVCIALTYIFGIGRKTALDVLDAIGIEHSVRAKTLTDDELSRLGAHIEDNYVIEGQLRRQESQNVARLRDIRCYRGTRHRAGLPTRGQRTRTNARTRKGPRKTVAVKRGVKDTRAK